MSGVSTNIIGVSVLDQYALTTVDNIRIQLGMPGSALTFDFIKKIERMINAATAHLEEYMHRQILRRAYTENQDSRGGNFVITRQYPILSISELWVDSTRLFTDVTKKLAPSSYAITDNETTIQTLDQNLPHGRQIVRVIYDSGFDKVPANIERAADLLVEWWYRFQEREDIGRSNKSKGDESTVISQGIPEAVKELVDSYRRVDMIDAPRTMAIT